MIVHISVGEQGVASVQIFTDFAVNTLSIGCKIVLHNPVGSVGCNNVFQLLRIPEVVTV